MGIIEIIFLAFALAMDAFAVSVCKGLASKKLSIKIILIPAFYFGIFQAGMPLIGYLVGGLFKEYIEFIDHWIAFTLLSIIGINMIREGFKKNDEEEKISASFAFLEMIGLAIATSIDALAVGITFSFLDVNLWLAIAIIGIITFILSMMGVKIGNKIGEKFQKSANIAGGAILILIGVRILLEDLGILRLPF